MALSLAHDATGSSGNSATLATTLPAPTVNDLIFVTPIQLTTGATFSTPTDNSSGGGAWQQLGSTLDAGTVSVGTFYKTANAQDHANLTHVSVASSVSANWSIATTSFTGFVLPAALDLSGSFTSGGGTTTDVSVTFGGAQRATEEITWYAVSMNGVFTGPLTQNYTPDGGVTTYSVTTIANQPSNNMTIWWAHPTTKGSSPKSVMQFSAPARVARSTSGTFYDPSTVGQGDFFLVL